MAKKYKVTAQEVATANGIRWGIFVNGVRYGSWGTYDSESAAVAAGENNVGIIQNGGADL